MSYSVSYNKPEVNLCLYFQTSGKSLCIFILPTYTDGKPPETAAWFCKWLEEASNDFRVERELLKGMKFAVFGLGNSQYKEHFNEVGHLHHLLIMECSNCVVGTVVSSQDNVVSEFSSGTGCSLPQSCQEDGRIVPQMMA
jgi:sulfite reductase alpha subunit-like flavoprotein